MSKNSLSSLSSYFLIIPAIAALPPPYQLNAPSLPIAPPSLLSDHVEALIKAARYQGKMLKEDDEREARATAVVIMRTFGDADKSFLAGEGGRSIGWRIRARY